MLQLLKKRANSCVRSFYQSEPKYVQSHLAVSPREMNQMRNRGIPISSHLEASKDFYDGDASPSVTIDPMFMRGIDINDAWNAQQSAKKSLLNAHRNDVEMYGK